MTWVEDTWLSEILKVKAYEITTSIEKKEDFILPKSSFFQLKIMTSDTEKFFVMQSLGFRVIDCNIYLTKKNIPVQILKKVNDDEVRWADKDDEDSVRCVARQSFQQNRFHRDFKIPNDIADSIKEKWAGNYFSGSRGDHMVVAEKNSKIVAFLLLVSNQKASLSIDLIAVLPEYQGMGIATKMIAFSLNNFNSSITEISVGTSIGNQSAISLYQKLGFKMVSSKYILHLHT